MAQQDDKIDYGYCIEQIRRNNFEAFDVIYNEFYARLVAYSCKYVGGSEDIAKDVAQETLLKLANNPPDSIQNNNLAPWLFRVARNLAIDKQRHARLEVPCGDTTGIEPENDSNPFQQLVNSSNADMIRAMILKLPEELKEIIEYRINRNISFKDIAEELNIPIGTALWRMHRAVQILRTLWNESA